MARQVDRARFRLPLWSIVFSCALSLNTLFPSSALASGSIAPCQVSSLESQVQDYLQTGLIGKPGIAQDLEAKLRAAADALARGQANTADNIVQAFINAVEAQDGKAISADAASALMAIATRSALVTVTVAPHTLAPLGTGSITGTVVTASGTPVPAVIVNLQASAGTILSPAATTDAGGAFRSGFVAPAVSGPVTITATVCGAAAAATAAVNVVAPIVTPTAFGVTGPPSTTAGTMVTIKVSAVDASGNIATGYTGTVSFFSGDCQATLPANYTFTAADMGVHSFLITFRTAGDPFLFVRDAVTGIQNGNGGNYFVVNPGPAVKYKLATPNGGPIVAGQSFRFRISALDAFGNFASSYRGTAHFSSTDSQAVLPADYTFGNVVAPMPEFRLDQAGALGSDGRIYELGGSTLSPTGAVFAASVDSYSTATNSWSAVAPLPQPRMSFGAATGADGRLYAVGGLTADPNSVEAYSVSSNSWTAAASMLASASFLGVAAGSDGRIYAVGGLQFTGAGLQTLNTAEVYTPATNTWTMLPPMPTPRHDLALVAGADGRIFAIGGQTDNTPVSAVEAYSPSTNSWTALAPVPFAGTSVGTRGPGGLIYIIGGGDVLEVYNPTTNVWNFLSTPPLYLGQGSAQTSFVAGTDGRLYLAGYFLNGCTGGFANGSTDTMVAYSPAQGGWIANGLTTVTVTLKTAGGQTVSATDTVNGSITGGLTVTVG